MFTAAYQSVNSPREKSPKNEFAAIFESSPRNVRNTEIAKQRIVNKHLIKIRINQRGMQLLKSFINYIHI